MTTMTAAEARRHVGFKNSARELDPAVSARMFALLEAIPADSSVDYAAILESATFIDPPVSCFHTAPLTARESILRWGLRPGASTNWPGKNVSSQPIAVYVATEPDLRGTWSHWDRWDIWGVDLTGLLWSHDRMNPGCYSVPFVPVDRIALLDEEGFSWA